MREREKPKLETREQTDMSVATVAAALALTLQRLAPASACMAASTSSVGSSPAPYVKEGTTLTQNAALRRVKIGTVCSGSGASSAAGPWPRAATESTEEPAGRQVRTKRTASAGVARPLASIASIVLFLVPRCVYVSFFLGRERRDGSRGARCTIWRLECQH